MTVESVTASTMVYWERIPSSHQCPDAQWHRANLEYLVFLTVGLALCGMGNVHAQFDSPITNFDGAAGGITQWVDYDNDGRLDFLVAGTGNNGDRLGRLYRNRGGGAFELAFFHVAALQQSAGAWEDYNQDGNIDVFATGNDNYLRALLYRNEGANGFATLFPTGLFPDVPDLTLGSVAWGDFNHDGRPDLLLTGLAWNNQFFCDVFRNDGRGGFSALRAGLPGVYASDAAWGDYNNDGLLDIAITGFSPPRLALIYRNNGDGTFTDIHAGLMGVGSSALAWGDYNNDGQLDLAIGGFDDANNRTCRIYRNEGNDRFTNINAGLPGIHLGSLAWGDYDGDGWSDLLLSGSGLAKVFRNQGNDTFRDIGAALTGVGSSEAAWGDFDNDGRLDIALSGHTGTSAISRIYRNLGGSTNRPPAAPTGLSTVIESNRVTFEWELPMGGSTPASALTYNLRVGTTPNGTEILSPLSDASGFRRVPRAGNVGQARRWTLSYLPGTFYWSVQAVDNAFAGSPFAPEQRVFVPGSPEAVTLEATEIKANDALLSGTITAGGSETLAWFEWGSSPALAARLDVAGFSASASNEPVSGRLTNLQPHSVYYYRAVASNGTALVYGARRTVTTLPRPPEVGAVTVTDLTTTRVTLQGFANGNGGDTLVRFEYGANPNSRTSTAWVQIGTEAASFGTSVTELTPGTFYYARMFATNAGGTATGADTVFRTLIAPALSNPEVADVTASSATLSATVNPNGFGTAVRFEYGLTPMLGSNTAWTPVGNGTNDVIVNELLSTLVPHAGYYFRAVTTNAGGTTVRPGPFFQTGPPFGTNLHSGLPGVADGIVAWGDFDHDGWMDALVAGRRTAGSPPAETRLYRNRGDGTFAETGTTLPAVESSAASWADFNGDGGLDFALCGVNGNGSISLVYSNRGDGTFAATGAGLPGLSHGSVAWGDFNNDGRPDLLMTGARDGDLSPLTELFRNEGGGVFSNLRTTLPGIRDGAAAWGDFNNDGWLDILLAGNSVTGAVAAIYRNNGNGSFSDIGAGLPAVAPAAVAWGDTDNDGVLEFALGGRTIFGTNLCRIYRRNGQGLGSPPYTNVPVSLPGIAGGVLTWGDYDADGRLDLLVAGPTAPATPSAVTRLLHNNNDGTFSVVPSNLPDLDRGTASWVDANNDGRLDAFATGLLNVDDPPVGVMGTNLTPTTNSAPSAPSFLNAFVTTNGIRFSWFQSVADGQTPAVGLSFGLRVGSGPGRSDLVSPDAATNGFRHVVRAGNAGQVTSWTLRDYAGPYPIFWSVQAVDSSFAGSPFATERIYAGPPHFNSWSRLSNGWFQLEIGGQPGYLDGIYATTNLSNWTFLGYLGSPAGGFISTRYTDRAATNFPFRFYQIGAGPSVP